MWIPELFAAWSPTKITRSGSISFGSVFTGLFHYYICPSAFYQQERLRAWIACAFSAHQTWRAAGFCSLLASNNRYTTNKFPLLFSVFTLLSTVFFMNLFSRALLHFLTCTHTFLSSSYSITLIIVNTRPLPWEAAEDCPRVTIFWFAARSSFLSNLNLLS